MHRYQQIGESLQEFNFAFSELIQAVTNHEFKDITNPSKSFLKPFDMWQPTLQEATDYVQKT